MFSTGQLIFAALFVLAFSIVLIFSYKKDKELHRKNYKGVKWVGIVFVLFVIILFGLKYLLKN
jgi:cytochrome bd-type quinol oxidase subunit 1